jgi:saccharopine dehydrogenase-like NADP-dependent oxidoreductase
MTAPDDSIMQAANEAGVKYLTLSTRENKLKICSVLSAHQQDLFLPSGLNPKVMNTLKKQEKECNLCKP